VNSSTTATFLSFSTFTLSFGFLSSRTHGHAACVAGVTLRVNQLYLTTFL
jgi:hypothetical protein